MGERRTPHPVFRWTRKTTLSHKGRGVAPLMGKMVRWPYFPIQLKKPVLSPPAWANIWVSLLVVV
jgi:hypothetical protein